ncbi:MAG: hypothetical protein ACOYL9_01745 [Ilumatobacteraceae bacterium]|jgi:hypothetical protein
MRTSQPTVSIDWGAVIRLGLVLSSLAALAAVLLADVAPSFSIITAVMITCAAISWHRLDHPASRAVGTRANMRR